MSTKKMVWVLFMTILSLTSSVIIAKADSVREWQEKGKRYHEKGQYDEAIAAFNKAIELDPNDAVSYFGRGSAYFKMGDQNKAVIDLSKAVELDPKDESYKKLLDLFKSFTASREQPKAGSTGSLNTGNMDKEKEAQGWFEKGQIFELNGDYNKAIEAYSKAIALHSKYSDAYYFNRAHVYYENGQYEASIKDYSKAIELTPSFPLAYAYNNRARPYRRLGHYDKAIADCNKAIELDPTYLFPYLNRALTNDDKGDFDNAIKDYMIVIERDSTGESAKTAQSMLEGLPGRILSQGDIFSDKKNYDRAIELYTKAIELSPKNAEAFFSRGYSYYEKDQFELAIKDYSKVIELNPKDVGVYINRGNSYAAIDNKDKAIADYNTAIKLDPKKAMAYNNRGAAYDSKGQYDKAIADFKKALDLDPQYEMAKNNLDRVKREVEKKKAEQKRIAMYKRYIDLYKKTKPANLNCGYNLRETNGVGQLSIGSDLYVSYQTSQGITDVKLPASVSQELSATARQRGYRSGSLELPFFVWFAENVLGTENPEESMTGLCYLTAMIKKSQFDTIQTFVGGYLDGIGKKK